MKSQALTIVLTAINLTTLMFILAHTHSATAQSPAPVLRVHALEIIDARGKTRAQIIVAPPTTMPDGKKYPETVLFRLIDPNGRPAVKIGASADGSGISLAGDSERREWSGVQILAEGPGASVKLTHRNGHVQVIEP